MKFPSKCLMGFLSCLISQPGFSASPAGPVEHCTLPVNLKLPVTPESKSWTVASLLAFSYRAHLIFTLTEQHWVFQFFGGIYSHYRLLQSLNCHFTFMDKLPTFSSFTLHFECSALLDDRSQMFKLCWLWWQWLMVTEFLRFMLHNAKAHNEMQPTCNIPVNVLKNVVAEMTM